MSQDERDSQLDSLLSGGKLSGPARDRILAAALRNAAPAPARARRMWLAPALSAAAAFALLFAVTRPTEFRARGAAGATLELVCRDGRLDACPGGGLLMIRVGGAVHGGALAAWSEPAAGGERTWYFPAADGTPLRVASDSTVQMLPAGLRLPPAGALRVHLRMCPAPVSRQEALAASDCEALDSDVTVVEKAP